MIWSGFSLIIMKFRHKPYRNKTKKRPYSVIRDLDIIMTCLRPIYSSSGRQLTADLNWNGQGESDCFIKTNHCDGW